MPFFSRREPGPSGSFGKRILLWHKATSGFEEGGLPITKQNVANAEFLRNWILSEQANFRIPRERHLDLLRATEAYLFLAGKKPVRSGIALEEIRSGMGCKVAFGRFSGKIYPWLAGKALKGIHALFLLPKREEDSQRVLSMQKLASRLAFGGHTLSGIENSLAHLYYRVHVDPSTGRKSFLVVELQPDVSSQYLRIPRVLRSSLKLRSPLSPEKRFRFPIALKDEFAGIQRKYWNPILLKELESLAEKEGASVFYPDWKAMHGYWQEYWKPTGFFQRGLGGLYSRRAPSHRVIKECYYKWPKDFYEGRGMVFRRASSEEAPRALREFSKSLWGSEKLFTRD